MYLICAVHICKNFRNSWCLSFLIESSHFPPLKHGESFTRWQPCDYTHGWRCCRWWCFVAGWKHAFCSRTCRSQWKLWVFMSERGWSTSWFRSGDSWYLLGKYNISHCTSLWRLFGLTELVLGFLARNIHLRKVSFQLLRCDISWWCELLSLTPLFFLRGVGVGIVARAIYIYIHKTIALIGKTYLGLAVAIMWDYILLGVI